MLQVIWQHIYFIRKTGLIYGQHLTGVSLSMNVLRSVSAKPNIYDYNTGYLDIPQWMRPLALDIMKRCQLQSRSSTTTYDTSKEAVSGKGENGVM